MFNFSCDDQNIASSLCEYCEEHLCDDCVKHHQTLKITTDHKISAITRYVQVQF